MKDRIMVWDLPVRAFHWLLAGSFAGAWLLSESERWRDVHVMLGYTVLGLVTLRIVWGLLYGVILTNARAMGEFGAVSVVSGHIRGRTNTIPLHVEILYNEYQFAAAFAVASLLTLLALVTLVVQALLRRRLGDASRR